jgi:hypothetical protein
VKQKRCGHPLRTRTAPGSSREMRVSGRPLRPGLLAFTPPSPKVRLGSKCGKSKSGRTRTTTRSASCVSSPNTHPTAHADRSRSSSARRHKRISSPCSPLSRHASGPTRSEACASKSTITRTCSPRAKKTGWQSLPPDEPLQGVPVDRARRRVSRNSSGAPKGPG